jgi:hypothetical protein
MRLTCVFVPAGTCLSSRCPVTMGSSQESGKGDTLTDTQTARWSHKPPFIFSKYGSKQMVLWLMLCSFATSMFAFAWKRCKYDQDNTHAKDNGTSYLWLITRHTRLPKLRESNVICVLQSPPVTNANPLRIKLEARYTCGYTMCFATSWGSAVLTTITSQNNILS